MRIRHKIRGNLIRLCLLFTILSGILYQLRIIIYYKGPEFRESDLKYILLWTSLLTDSSEVFRAMGEGQSIFLSYDCPVSNCYVTSDKTFMKEVSDFHTILFHGPDINLPDTILPEKRLPSQKYVFQSLESSGNYPIRDDIYDNFFNLTWSYKLNSDVYIGYILVKNKNGVVIGPRITMNWLKLEEMKSIDAQLKNELLSKNRLAAWFMSNHWTLNRRFDYVEAMQYELAKFKTNNLTIDIFGTSSDDDKKCPIDEMDRCKLMLRKYYYFYLSFENSNCEDYVTEKLLTALQNYAVPVVFGGANYTRFMPNGAYLNARQYHPKELVQKMVDIATNKTKYYDFFRWTNYYSYHDAYENPETNPYCRFCSKINEEVPIISFYSSFRNWWICPMPKHRKRKQCIHNYCI